MYNTELAYQIEMLTQIVGRLCEAAHLDGMLENIALQHGLPKSNTQEFGEPCREERLTAIVIRPR